MSAPRILGGEGDDVLERDELELGRAQPRHQDLLAGAEKPRPQLGRAIVEYLIERPAAMICVRLVHEYEWLLLFDRLTVLNRAVLHTQQQRTAGQGAVRCKMGQAAAKVPRSAGPIIDPSV